MDHKGKSHSTVSLKRAIIFSSIVHVVVFISLSVVPGIYLPMREHSSKFVWVELPKGTSDEIGLGIKKSAGLPESTIEEQKRLFQPEQKSLAPEMKAPATAQKPPEKMTEPSKSKAPVTAQPKRATATDRKIANALAMIDKQLANRTITPEAGQIKQNTDGYKYGTGNQPLKVLPSDPEYLKYQAMLRSRIISEWVLPMRYVEEGGGRRNCAIEVLISMEGDVISTRWERQSGDPTFDQSALRAVRKASPFPKPPDRLAWEAYNEGFLIEFDPRLKPQ